MNSDRNLAALADLNGILPSYYDLHGGERITSPETQKALLVANGIDVSTEAAIESSLAEQRYQIDDRWFPEEIIVESGAPSSQNFGLGAEWQLRLDESDEIVAQGEPSDHITLPALSSGVYSLTATASGRTEVVSVLAAPRRLPMVNNLSGASKHWGLNLALYGLRSKRNSGLGDFEDLGRAAQVIGRQGAAFFGINPLHNMGYSELDAISPYSPSHRGFLNTAYIALDSIPGVTEPSVSEVFDKLKSGETLQYKSHKIAHNQILEGLFSSFNKEADENNKSDFSRFKELARPELREFARFEALSETHGVDWRDWPRELGRVCDERIEFHMWLQWVATTQLEAAQSRAKSAGMPFGLYLDLAVGARRDGAESWCEQSAIAQGVSIGAPPDHLSPEGQKWNLAAFAPRKLKAQRYRPLRRILRQTIRHAGIIRIDHVLGLNRSFWIPDDGSPGAYIRQPFESLLAIIKIEAERTNCVVIGEDLGLVPDGFRETMRDHGFYGYSVLQYEKDRDGKFRDPSEMSSQVLSCFATHDTPTVKGYEIGRDIDWWLKLDWVDEQGANHMRQERTSQIEGALLGLDFQTSIHTLLARSNADLVAVQLDDILGLAEAQNLPGTVDQHPNWRRKYDVDLRDLSDHEQLIHTAATMRVAGRAHNQRTDP